MLVATLPTTILPRRLPEAQASVHAMAAIPTAWGLCAVVWKNHESETEEGFAERPSDALLCRIYTPGLSLPELRATVLRRIPGCLEVIADHHGMFHPETVPVWFSDIRAFLQSYYRASLRKWSRAEFTENWAFWRQRLDWAPVTPFQRRVLEIVASIPSGTRWTYGQVARSIGQPSAARAVGAAIGSNPWPVLVPCHRVVGTSGKLTGFSAPGGVETKRRMLELEAG
jgi:O-6-methylguanine DNA methyltransferase